MLSNISGANSPAFAEQDANDVTRASEELTNAALAVAFLAQELASNAEPAREGGYLVWSEDMQDLRDALRRWTEASNAALAAIARAQR